MREKVFCIDRWSDESVSRGDRGLRLAGRKIPKWQRLGEAMLALHLFLKGQGKKDDLECDILFYHLWIVRKEAFLHVNFNKLHWLFCTTAVFVHKYGMTGRVSEESLESFNPVLGEVKRVLWSMPTTTGQMKETNEQMQEIWRKRLWKIEWWLRRSTPEQSAGNTMTDRDTTIGQR